MTHSEPRSRLVTAADLARSGVSRRTRESAVADGRLHVVRHGVYLPDDAVPTGPGAARERLLLRTVAAAPMLQAGTAISHVAALAIHGLPTYGMDTRTVTTTRHLPGSGTRSGRNSVCFSADLSGAVDEVEGIVVTSVARTVVDVARTGALAGAVAAADEALRHGLCTRSQLEAELELARGKIGVSVARQMVPFADGAAESVLESISRVAINQLGLPVPRLQVELRLSNGSRVRPDFYWEQWRLFGECDGLGKYGIDDGADSVRAAVKKEKVRQAGIESDGFRMARWMWEDAVEPPRLGNLLGRAFRLQERAGYGP